MLCQQQQQQQTEVLTVEITFVTSARARKFVFAKIPEAILPINIHNCIVLYPAIIPPVACYDFKHLFFFFDRQLPPYGSQKKKQKTTSEGQASHSLASWREQRAIGIIHN